MKYKEIEDFPKYYVCRDGYVYSFKFKKEMRKLFHRTRPDGYVEVQLRHNGKLHYLPVHRLVAKAFIANPDEKPCVNHLNGVKDDNRVENLEWATYKENTRHAFDTGLISRIGEGSEFCTSTEDQVRQCCQLLQDTKMTTDQIAEAVGISKDVVSKIKRKDAWTHISCEYQLPPIRKVNKPLTEEEVKNICCLLNSGMRPLHIARKLGIDRNVVNRIKYGKSYKDISKKYLHTTSTTIESTSGDGSE